MNEKHKWKLVNIITHESVDSPIVNGALVLCDYKCVHCGTIRSIMGFDPPCKSAQ